MKSLEKEYREQMEEIHAPEDLIQKTKEMMRAEEEKWENGKDRRYQYPDLFLGWKYCTV